MEESLRDEVKELEMLIKLADQEILDKSIQNFQERSLSTDLQIIEEEAHKLEKELNSVVNQIKNELKIFSRTYEVLAEDIREINCRSQDLARIEIPSVLGQLRIEKECRAEFPPAEELTENAASEIYSEFLDLENKLKVAHEEALELRTLKTSELSMRKKFGVSAASGEMSRNKRVDWDLKLFRRNPEILELCQRVDPVHRVLSFCQHYSKSPEILRLTENKLRIEKSPAFIVHLICQVLPEPVAAQISSSILGDSPEFFTFNGESDDSNMTGLSRIILSAAEAVDSLFHVVMSKRITEIPEELQFAADGLVSSLGLEIVEPDAVNYWEEEESSLDNIRKTRNLEGDSEIIVAANINKLIEQLTEIGTDLGFTTDFLLTYQMFMRPEALLRKLKERFDVPKSYESTARTIRLRVVNVLIKWLNIEMDSLETSVLSAIEFFVNSEIATSDVSMTMTQFRKIFKSAWGKRLGKKQKSFPQLEMEELEGRRAPPEPVIPRNIFSPKLKLLDIDPGELARQITIYVFEQYSKIRPSELNTLAWTKKHLKHRAKNITEFITQFNEFTLHLTSTILMQSEQESRSKVIERYVSLGRELESIGNYSSLMCVIASITNPSVSRLRRTMAEVSGRSRKEFKRLKRLMSSSNGYHSYRDMISLRAGNLPTIPHIGVHLSDLIFIHESEPTFKDGLVNFAKSRAMARILRNLQEFQEMRYNFFSVYQIQELLRKRMWFMTEIENYEKSLLLEPRV